MKSAAEVTMVWQKETKNTVQFKAVIDDETYPVVDTIYIRKSWWKRLGEPDNLLLIIDAGGGKESE